MGGDGGGARGGRLRLHPVGTHPAAHRSGSCHGDHRTGDADTRRLRDGVAGGGRGIAEHQSDTVGHRSAHNRADFTALANPTPHADPRSGDAAADPDSRPTATPRPTPTPTASSLAVRIADFAFSPTTVTVRVGTRVTWTNRQLDIQHTVTADGGSFGSGPLSTGSSFSHVFIQAGTYTYHCSIHPDMTGTVIVGG